MDYDFQNATLPPYGDRHNPITFDAQGHTNNQLAATILANDTNGFLPIGEFCGGWGMYPLFFLWCVFVVFCLGVYCCFSIGCEHGRLIGYIRCVKRNFVYISRNLWVKCVAFCVYFRHRQNS